MTQLFWFWQEDMYNEIIKLLISVSHFLMNLVFNTLISHTHTHSHMQTHYSAHLMFMFSCHLHKILNSLWFDVCKYLIYCICVTWLSRSIKVCMESLMDASYRSVIWFSELLVKKLSISEKHEFKVNSRKSLCIILNDQWKLFLFEKRKKVIPETLVFISNAVSVVSTSSLIAVLVWYFKVIFHYVSPFVAPYILGFCTKTNTRWWMFSCQSCDGKMLELGLLDCFILSSVYIFYSWDLCCNLWMHIDMFLYI